MDGKILKSIVMAGFLLGNGPLEVFAMEDETLEKGFFGAICRGDKSCIRRFLKKGANVDDDSLQSVAFCDSIGILRLLLDHRGPNLKNDSKNPKMYLWSPLHLAVLRGSTKRVELLLDAGADINAKDKDGRTPLMWLIDTILYLGYTKNEANSRPPLRKVALHLPPKERSSYKKMLIRLYNNCPTNLKGHLAILDLFLERGADVNVQDNDGNTALHWVLIRDKFYYFSKYRQQKPILHRQLVRKLIEAGADAQITNNDGQTLNDLYSND
ncbi:MAG: ankyrin repeat domain-containing protein [Puniceicoccales bacterium]|jgi:ankyrin repeat protein|nr:ankyrin repeat domain-containing protein [Puniceicoccales bacterium]